MNEETKAAKKVLVVDDDNDLNEALKEKISKKGFHVLIAKDGEEGLKKALEHHPDVTILDIIMPKMDGITMLKKLRADGWGANAPVIMLTNINEKEKLAEALETGIDEYLVKTDVTLNDIVNKIEKIVGTSV